VVSKAELRREMRARLMAVPPEEAVAWSLALCDRLWASPLVRGAATVLAFVPLPGEADIRPLLGRVLQSGRRLCLPRVEWGSKSMVAATVESLSELVEGRHQILQPPEGNPEVAEGDLDAVLVPGLAFDERGARLGRGAGFYDRFLARPGLRRGMVCGVAFEVQMVQDVPTDPWDVRLDAIATESRWMEAGSRP
jgi:5-formyltetrahydrofolate cyclo-ligase